MKENALENKTEITNIHFLIHPGYELRYDYNPEFFPLAESYVEKAKTLKPDELMVFFAPVPPTSFPKEVKADQEKYVEVANRIREILGRRLIVLSSQGETSSLYKKLIWNKIKTIAEKRGFVFTKNLTAEAYGEYLGVCVSRAAENMHQASGMSAENPITIRAELTDKSISGNVAYLEHFTPNTRIDTSKFKKEDI